MKGYLAIGLSVGLAACQSVRSEVTTFHTLPEQSVKTFWVSPAQGPPLETASYAGLIAQNLEEHGWTPTKDSPEITVQFSYGIDTGETRVGSVPIVGQTGGGTTFSNGMITGPGGFATYSGTSYTPATFGVVGEAPYSFTVYTRFLTVTMTDAKSGAPVFEGTARSKGSSGNFARVAPCLIRALFKGFPAPSGSTQNVSIPSSECT
jgi:hypothetical protein